MKMSYSIVLSNGLPVSLSVSLLGKNYNIGSEMSITVMGVTDGTQVQVLTDRDVVVRFTNAQGQNSLVPLLGNNTPFFLTEGQGTYGIFLAGNTVIPGQVTVKSIVDRILYNPCNFEPEYPVFPYGVDQFAGNNAWFNNSPCEYNWFQEILAMLNVLLRDKTEAQRVKLLNEAVVTEIPFQGVDDITLLEASILIRSPSLVARLLALGADPNISTSGINLVNQIIAATGYDFYNGNFPEDQAIVDALLRAGANVYPGFPGTSLPYNGFPYWQGNAFNGCSNGLC